MFYHAVFNGASFSTNQHYGGHFDLSFIPHRRHPKLYYRFRVCHEKLNGATPSPIRPRLVKLWHFKNIWRSSRIFSIPSDVNLPVVTFWAESCYILDQLSQLLHFGHKIVTFWTNLKSCYILVTKLLHFGPSCYILVNCYKMGRNTPSYRTNLMQMSCRGRSLIFVTIISKVSRSFRKYQVQNHVHIYTINLTSTLLSASKSVKTCNSF